MAAGILELAQKGCDCAITVLSRGTFFQDGIQAQLIDQVVSQGVPSLPLRASLRDWLGMHPRASSLSLSITHRSPSMEPMRRLYIINLASMSTENPSFRSAFRYKT
jgi:hypothetical protein